MPQIKQFFASSPEKTFKKGSVIISPEDKLENIYYLSSGIVKMSVLNSTGEEITIHLFRPGSFFPMMLAISNTPNRYYFQAQTNVKVKISPRQKALEFLKKERAALYDLTVRFANGLEGLANRLESLHGEKALNRIVSLFLYLSDKFGTVSSEGVKINLPLTHQEIANWVGLERETVSRQMKTLSNKGLIKYERKKLTLTDTRSLVQLLVD